MSSNSNQATEQEFGPIRKLIWPIHNYELKKFIPLSLIMFCILFNYTVMRDIKDTLVVNSMGASATTFLKLWFVTPCAILFVIFYGKLTNALKREYIFYTIVTPFIIFFGLFAFVLYPNLSVLHAAPETIEALGSKFPHFIGFIDMGAYWSYSLFYVLAEIWGSAMIALMFWQFANQIVRMREAKRFYGLFVVISNLALICSGLAVNFFSKDLKSFFPEGTAAKVIWGVSLKWQMAMVVIIGIATMMIYRWMHTSVLPDPRYYDGDDVAIGAGKKKKQKLGFVESCKIIIKSPELGYIALLIMAYGVTINLVEVQWKHQLKLFCAGDEGMYGGFMGMFSAYTGFFTILFSLIVGSNVLRVLSWFKAAVITPTFILVAGSILFSFILVEDISFLKDFVGNIMLAIGTNPITAAAFLGGGLVLMAKGIKYSLFDPTKEMAYIPLDDELKTKGKAAVDVIGGRAGKAGGAAVQSVLFMLFMTKDAVAIAPICFGVFAVVCLLWMFAVKGLSTKVNAAVERKNREVAEAAAGAQPATTSAQTA